MGHKLLFTCVFIGSLAAAAPARGGEAVPSYRVAAAVEALVMVGARYKYGGSSPETGFDCSGLVTHVFESAWGMTLPRSVEQQHRVGHAVKLKDLQPGDLVFYNTRHRPFSHVGIYIGDGNFIHAPRRGQRVRVESIGTAYWRARFDGARRLDPPSY